MNRIWKTLASALTGSIILASVIATAAAAQPGKITSDGPTERTNVYTMFGLVLECAPVGYTGYKYNVTPHEAISNESTTFTLTPVNEPCALKNGESTFFMTVTNNGCDYVIHIGKTEESKQYAATTDVVCPEGKSIELEEYASSSEKLKLCTYSIKSQNGLSGLHITSNATADDIDITGTLTGIHMQESGSLCKVEEFESQMDTKVTLRGTNAVAEPTGVTVTDKESGQGVLTADGQVTLDASAVDGSVRLALSETGGAGSNAFTMFGDRVECPGSTYGGATVGNAGQPLANGSTAATLTPSFHQVACIAKFKGEEGSLPATVALNGCDYVLHIGETTGGIEGTYGATTDIVCPTGATIQLTVFNNEAESEKRCTFTIKAQTALTGADVRSTSGAGDFDLSGTIGSVHVEKSGICEAGTTSEGAIDIDTTVKGFNRAGLETSTSISE